jgi:hypothetical protein
MSESFSKFGFPNLNDEQFKSLLLYETVQLKSEIRALSSLILKFGKIDVSDEKLKSLFDMCHDAALVEMESTIRQIRQAPKDPDKN